jgi:hypothetical protein
MKYVEVQVNFLGPTIAEDEQLAFCVNGPSEHKAVALAKELIEQLERKEWDYSGRATRKEKPQQQKESE